uniref:Uncharacterized protein n=1 Tax=Morchella brunnea TaxID=1174671 RepID=A0A8K1I7Q5_9PEZI|nr:hypothetical protein LK370_mgp011 [Morchella brunnea]UBU98468.1 hypothetical protein [Morchella brunnea]
MPIVYTLPKPKGQGLHAENKAWLRYSAYELVRPPEWIPYLNGTSSSTACRPGLHAVVVWGGEYYTRLAPPSHLPLRKGRRGTRGCVLPCTCPFLPCMNVPIPFPLWAVGQGGVGTFIKGGGGGERGGEAKENILYIPSLTPMGMNRKRGPREGG